MEPSLDLMVQLPRGIQKDGLFQTKAEVRELTGRDEEVLARIKDNQATFDAIVALGTEKLGSIDMTGDPQSARDQVLSGLLVGERMMLYLAIVRATFGNEKTLDFLCTNCDSHQETTILVDVDFPVVVPEEGIKNSYSFITSKGHTILFRLVEGRDVKAVSLRKASSPAERNTLVLSQVILQVDGQVPNDTETYVKDMGIKDRTDLLAAIQEHQPTVDFTLEIECTSCGEGQQIPLQWSELFRP